LLWPYRHLRHTGSPYEDKACASTTLAVSAAAVGNVPLCTISGRATLGNVQLPTIADDDGNPGARTIGR
jgi:hypothetical protein